MHMKQQINFRASALTAGQVEWLMQEWGTSQTETLTVVVDRMYQHEKRKDTRMNAAKVKMMFDALDRATENRKWTESRNSIGLEIDEPAPIVAAPAAVPYDLDAPDSEWHDKPITSPQMALDVIGAGKTLMTQCGPLQVQVTQMYFNEIQITMWSTVTCTDASTVIEESEVVAHLGVFGSLTDGTWKVYCPAEPDGAPQY